MVLSSLVQQGILGSETPKGPVSLRFPSDAVEILFPLYLPKGSLQNGKGRYPTPGWKQQPYYARVRLRCR